jgi:hypothetical protein
VVLADTILVTNGRQAALKRGPSALTFQAVLSAGAEIVVVALLAIAGYGIGTGPVG